MNTSLVILKILTLVSLCCATYDPPYQQEFNSSYYDAYYDE